MKFQAQEMQHVVVSRTGLNTVHSSDDFCL